MDAHLLLLRLRGLGLLLDLRLGRGLGLLHLGAEGDLAHDGNELRLVDAGGEPASDVRELATVRRVEDHAEREVQGADERDVREGDAAAHEEGVLLEVRVHDLQRGEDVLLRLDGDALVELHPAEDLVHPVGDGEVQVGGAEVHPLVDLAGLEVRGAHQLRVSAQAADVLGDRVGLEDAALRRLQRRDLAKRVEREELGRLVGLAHDEARRDGDVDAIVLGGDQRLVGAGVAREGVQLEGHGYARGSVSVAADERKADRRST